VSDHQPHRKLKIRPVALQLWLTGIDPGLIRLLTAGRAALALLSIWWVLRTGLYLLLQERQPIIPLFGVLTGFVLLIFVSDLKPSKRKVSLWLATVPFAGMIILASLLSGNFWLYSLILLLLFFFSYYFRRYGTRAGELALIATVGYYLGFLLNPSPKVYPILLACVIISALLVYLWLFVIIPYDPEKFLYRSVRAFSQNVAQGIAAIQRVLDSKEENAPVEHRLQRYYKQVNRNRRVIEGLFAAAVSPSLWSQPRLNQLQEEMFKVERGFELLIEATNKVSSLKHILPDDILLILKEGMSALEDQLWQTNFGEGQSQASEAGDWLQARIKSSLAEEPSGEWVFPLQRIGITARQIAASVENMHAIGISWSEVTVESPNRPKAPASSKIHINLFGRKMDFSFHPTTTLGLQAVLATGLAMLVAFLLKMDHPNLVFWSAFVVIAGSTGESLRRISMRVIGVILGTLAGVLLAYAMPDNLTFMVVLVTGCFFMTVYVLPISYVWMVFFINIATLMIITVLGGDALEVLALRTVSTLLGVVIAALVVMYVFPIRVQNRFANALSEFMGTVDLYIEAYVAQMVGSTGGELDRAGLNIDASYKKLELTLPSLNYEYNPLTRGQNKFSGQGINLAVLNGYVTHLKDEVGAEPGSLGDTAEAELIRSIQAGIHANVESLTQYLSQGMSERRQAKPVLHRRALPKVTLGEFSSENIGAAGALSSRMYFHLLRIHDTILQIGTGLGIPVSKEE
jgi:hypothetical protein